MALGKMKSKICDCSDTLAADQATNSGMTNWGKLIMATLINRTQYEYAGGNRAAFYSTSLRWDYSRFLGGKKFELFAAGEAARPLSGVADYTYESEVGIRYKVTEWAALNLKYLKDVVIGTGDGNDLYSSRFIAGVGVTWWPFATIPSVIFLE